MGILFLRLIFPILILIYPLFGFLGGLYLDNLDFKLYNVQNEDEYIFYQNVDKVLDMYLLAFALFVALRWKDVVSKRIAILAYFYRLLGVIIYFIQQKEAVFVLFPNFLETFFVFYLVYKYFNKDEDLFKYPGSMKTILPLLLVPKIAHELTHITAISDFINPYRNFTLGGLYLLFPSIALIWRLRLVPRNKRSRKKGG